MDSWVEMASVALLALAGSIAVAVGVAIALAFALPQVDAVVGAIGALLFVGFPVGVAVSVATGETASRRADAIGTVLVPVVGVLLAGVVSHRLYLDSITGTDATVWFPPALLLTTSFALAVVVPLEAFGTVRYLDRND